MSIAAYVAEDDLVSHYWEERHLVLRRLYSLVQGTARAKKWEWVSWGVGGGVCGDFWDSIGNVNEINTQ